MKQVKTHLIHVKMANNQQEPLARLSKQTKSHTRANVYMPKSVVVVSHALLENPFTSEFSKYIHEFRVIYHYHNTIFSSPSSVNLLSPCSKSSQANRLSVFRLRRGVHSHKVLLFLISTVVVELSTLDNE